MTSLLIPKGCVTVEVLEYCLIWQEDGCWLDRSSSRTFTGVHSGPFGQASCSEASQKTTLWVEIPHQEENPNEEEEEEEKEQEEQGAQSLQLAAAVVMGTRRIRIKVSSMTRFKNLWPHYNKRRVKLTVPCQSQQVLPMKRRRLRFSWWSAKLSRMKLFQMTMIQALVCHCLHRPHQSQPWKPSRRLLQLLHQRLPLSFPRKCGIDDIGFAVSNRSSCYYCKNRIVKGQVRLSWYFETRRPSSWVHVDCVKPLICRDGFRG